MRLSHVMFSAALLAAPIQAHEATAARVAAIGLKGGVSLATLHGALPSDPFVQNGWRLGAAGGVSVTIGLGSWLSLQPELLFAAKGTTLGSADLTDSAGTVVGSADITQANNYLEVPILARVAIPAGGLASPYLLAGPTVGVRLSEELRLTGDASVSFDSDYVKGTDLGLALGAGVDVGRGRARWSLESRYTLGLTVATEGIYSDRARNGDLLVMAGLSIHL